jgi:hypothetical protein
VHSDDFRSLLALADPRTGRGTPEKGIFRAARQGKPARQQKPVNINRRASERRPHDHPRVAVGTLAQALPRQRGSQHSRGPCRASAAPISISISRASAGRGHPRTRAAVRARLAAPARVAIIPALAPRLAPANRAAPARVAIIPALAPRLAPANRAAPARVATLAQASPRQRGSEHSRGPCRASAGRNTRAGLAAPARVGTLAQVATLAQALPRQR